MKKLNICKCCLFDSQISVNCAGVKHSMLKIALVTAADCCIFERHLFGVCCIRAMNWVLKKESPNCAYRAGVLWQVGHMSIHFLCGLKLKLAIYKI